MVRCKQPEMECMERLQRTLSSSSKCKDLMPDEIFGSDNCGFARYKRTLFRFCR